MPLNSKPFLHPEEQVEDGNRLFAQGDLHGAIARYEAALAERPGYARAHYNAAIACERLGRSADAARHYAAALESEPRMTKAMVNWGNLLKDAGDLEAAASMYRRAVEADPREAHALNNLASIALEGGALEEAKALYARAAAAAPDMADPRYNLGLLALRAGDFAAGWEGFELRLRADPRTISLRPPDLPRAEAPDLVRGARVAIPREQGLGDQLLMSTLLPELAARGVEAVVEVDPRLADAFRRSLPALAYVTPAEAPAAFARCERQIPLGSLPRLLRRRREDFSSQPRALLQPLPERLRAMRAHLGEGRRIAISWRSFQGHGRAHVGARKSAQLECFAAFEHAGVRLVDVQYGDVREERAAFDQRHSGLRFPLDDVDLRDDLEGALAAIAACDLVVTTSNVTAHLAGALGKRTWLVYLAANPPFHYWAAQDDGRSLWYPSVEVVTAPHWNEWGPAFGALARRWGRETRA